MGLLLLVLLALLAAGGLTWFALSEPGYVLISYGEWNVETSLAILTCVMLLVFVVLYVAVRLVRHLLRAPRTIASFNQRNRVNKSRKKLDKGLLELAEGSWSKAELHLLESAADIDSPMINYLAAARAAQMQGGSQRRDDYLREAHECNPDAVLAVGISKAELQLAHDQTEQALATLNKLRERAPRHGYVLRLLARAHDRVKEWEALLAVLPALRKSKMVADARLVDYETRASEGVLEQAAEKGSIEALSSAWNKLSRPAKANPRLVMFYALHLHKLGDDGTAANLVRTALNNGWDESLAYVYGVLESGDDTRQLDQIETWLKDHERSAALLLSAGRVCNRKQLWGKARIYFESSLGIKPLPEGFRELAALAEQLGDPDGAKNYYRQGLIAAVDGEASLKSTATPVSELATDPDARQLRTLEEGMYPV